MARPKNKAELSKLNQQNFKRLLNYIDDLPEELLHAEFPKGVLNRNIRDVLAHLYHWQVMFLDWYRIGMSGEKPIIPAEGYTWKMTPELNMMIRDKYSKVELSVIRRKLTDTHKEICELIREHTNEELFEKKRYKWTGSTHLGSYMIGATSSHYDWAYKLIQKCLKKLSLEMVV